MQLYPIFDAIIREYDLRGPVNEKAISESQAYSLGLRFGSYLNHNAMKSCAVSYDGRVSSPMLCASLVDGLRKAGVNVVEIGLGPSPQLYFAVQTLGVDAGIIVTGSHNPASDNGFKISLKTRPFFGKDLRSLQTIPLHLPQHFGQVKTTTVMGSYSDRILRDYRPVGKPLKIVFDAGNGAAGPVLSFIKDRLHGEVILINNEVDGNFPNHHPDPSVPHNMVQLQEAVAKHKADVGFAFDGDADRLGVIDNKGQILSPDAILLMLAKAVLADKPKAQMVADVKTSQVFFDEMQKAGAVTHLCRTGHSLIKEKMAETGAVFAGEMSGHIFFKDHYFGYDDGIYAAIRFLNILHKSNESLDQIHAQIPKLYNTPMLKVACDDARKFAVIEHIQQDLTSQGIAFDAIDGVRFSNDKGWWLIRASNTEPALVVRCESYEEADLSEFIKQVTEILSSHQLVLPA